MVGNFQHAERHASLYLKACLCDFGVHSDADGVILWIRFGNVKGGLV